MLVPQLLLETLEDLTNDEFRTLKWYLSQEGMVEGCKPIGRSHLQDASRVDTVDRILRSYKEDLAVKVTVEILRKMNNNLAADDLISKFTALNTATPSSTSSSSSSAGAPQAAPAGMTAQENSVIIAPAITGGTTASWNITINK